MSALCCPFWCRVHRDGTTLAERPHEAVVTTLASDDGLGVTVALRQDERRAQPRLEVAVDGHAAVLPLDDAQALIRGLRELYGMAQRAGASA